MQSFEGGAWPTDRGSEDLAGDLDGDDVRIQFRRDVHAFFTVASSNRAKSRKM